MKLTRRNFLASCLALATLAVACVMTLTGMHADAATLANIAPSLTGDAGWLPLMGIGMATFSEPNRIGDLLKREWDALFNREVVTVSGGVDLLLGTVVGKIDTSGGSASAQAAAGNTGNGAMGAITVGNGAKDGEYTLTITAAAANAGSFEVVDPDGVIVGTGTVGVAFNSGGLSFTLADGSTDFAEDDAFAITVVTDQAGQWAQYDAAATDGRETAAGILLEPAEAAAGDVQAVILKRGPAVIAEGALVFAASQDAADKAAAIAALEALGIVARKEIGAAPVAIS